MHTVAYQTLPGFVAYRLIDCSLQITLLDAPCHTIEEEGCAAHLLAAVIGIRYETGVPKSVLWSLAVLQRLAHQQEILLQLLVILIFRREQVHAAHEGSIYPPVTTTPVAVLAVRSDIRSYIVLVSPPEAFLHVEESASECVAAPGVHLHRVVGIFALAGNLIDLHIEWHGHLDGIDPGPPAVERALGLRLHCVGCLHLVVQVLDDLGNLLLTSALHIAVGIGLSAALVVGIIGLYAIAGSPLVETAPAICIVDVAGILVDLIECHQSLVVDGTSPERRRANPVHVGGQGRVGILRHEVVVGQSEGFHHIVSLLALCERNTCHQQGDQCQG